MEEAIASSQLEGAATTRKLAKEMLRLNKKPRTYDEKMIVNGYRTMKRITELTDEKLTPELILDLHAMITKDTLKQKKEEGAFRDNNDIVVGDTVYIEKIYHRPPDYKQVPKLMEELCDFVNAVDENKFIHPVIKSIIVHFLIGYIHPFTDGNGRLARTLFYWYVIKRGYWLFEFMAVSRIILQSKTKYGLAYLYTETDDNDLTYFINYNLEIIEKALNEMQKYIAHKQKEQAEALKFLQGSRDINLRQADILKEFVKNADKNFLIKEIMTTYNVAYDTARHDLLHLTNLKYITVEKRRNKFLFRYGGNLKPVRSNHKS